MRRITAAVNGPVRKRDGNVIDKGFNNIGVRPTEDDLGVSGSDGFGPLLHSKRLFPGVLPATFDGATVSKGFKIRSLRNVALTAPYFHNGDVNTLRQVVELYSRGGNVAPIAQTDGTPIEPLGVPLLSIDEITAIVALFGNVDRRARALDERQRGQGGGRDGRDPCRGCRGRRSAARPGFLEGVFGPGGGVACY